MGDTISILVFRPPPPTPIHPSDFFYLDVDVHSPLCTNKNNKSSYRRRPESSGASSTGSINGKNCFIGGSSCVGSGSGAMCLDDNGESDLASLDAIYLTTKEKKKKETKNQVGSRGRCSPSFIDIDDQNSLNRHGSANDDDDDDDDDDEVPNNVRNGQVYRIPAFFIRRRNATQTILFSHGNAEDLGMMYPRMKDLALVLGVNILAYEYTGYGLSIPGPTTRGKSIGRVSANEVDNEGRKLRSDRNDGISNEGPSENMTYRNIEAAYRYLTEVRKIPPQQIILYGRSLGSGPSCYLAAKTALNGDPVGGLVLHSPFLSVYKVVADLNGLDMSMVGDLFQNERRARNVRCPTLIIHGREDEVVPFWHAPRLLATIPPEYRARPFYVDGMGHNHIESKCRDQYIDVMISFLKMGVQNECSESGGDLMQASVQHVTNGFESTEAKENLPSFYINKTWLRHARVLLKEVFFSDLGSMCHVNQNSVSHEESDGQWKESTTSQSSAHLSDARDVENEFSPWSGAGSNHSNQSPGNNIKHGQQRQQRQARAQYGKILTPRYNDVNNNHPSDVTPRGSQRHNQKPQSLKPTAVDSERRQQQQQQHQLRRFSTSDMKFLSPRSQNQASSKQKVNLFKEVSHQRRSYC